MGAKSAFARKRRVTLGSAVRQFLKHLARTLLVAAVILGIKASVSRSGSTWMAADLFPSEPETQHLWALHDGKHWQVVSSTFEASDVTDAAEQTRGACPTGMVEVRGQMKLDAAPISIEAMQKLLCTRWLDEEYPDRCAAFDEERWLHFVADLPTIEMAYCIDRFEYPNMKGQYPWVFVTWTEAADLCAVEGKRLCSEDEWTFACEGENASPYPYGFVRSQAACVIDRPWRAYEERAFADRASRAALIELDRLWQGEPSGARPLCRSPFGVYDMTGNVDEWTRSTVSQGYRSVFKGGYWAPVRNRCRPSTRAHAEIFSFYQQGFRCCADPMSR